MKGCLIGAAERDKTGDKFIRRRRRGVEWRLGYPRARRRQCTVTEMIECRLIKARMTFRFLYRHMTNEQTRPGRSAILSHPSPSVRTPLGYSRRIGGYYTLETGSDRECDADSIA